MEALKTLSGRVGERKEDVVKLKAGAEKGHSALCNGRLPDFISLQKKKAKKNSA